MGKVRKVILALALVMAVLVGGIGPLGSVASASHNPTVSCWYVEGTNPGDPAYGPHWERYSDGWWSYTWWHHYEDCEDGWWQDLGWHQHWTYHGW